MELTENKDKNVVCVKPVSLETECGFDYWCRLKGYVTLAAWMFKISEQMEMSLWESRAGTDWTSLQCVISMCNIEVVFDIEFKTSHTRN